MARLTFFIGKGGVGKTTLASTYAVHRASRARSNRVLLVSSDPAHSLADIFGVRLGSAPKRVPAAKGQLFLWHIDAEKEFRSFLARRKEALLRAVESGTLFTRAEIEPLLDTALPGMAELGALLALRRIVASARWNEVIVDTAPIGHTLRLFALPQHFVDFTRFLELAASRDQWLSQRFGSGKSPAGALLDDLAQAARDMERLVSGEASSAYLVTTAEQFSLKQAVRSMSALRELGSALPLPAIILNRAVQQPSTCERCKAMRRRTIAAGKVLRRAFPTVRQVVSLDPGAPIIGVATLQKHAAATFGNRAFKGTRARAKQTVHAKPVPWPGFEAPLTFTVGKGGVGKTTISASMALIARAREKMRTTICSTDPAPSLDEVFQTDVQGKARSVLGDANLLALEVDSVSEFRRWSAAMQARVGQALSSGTGKVGIDVSYDRRIFTALLDIVPPGVDEIFAILKIIDLTSQGKQRVIIDMAPTGHALELLRLPERMAQWSRLLLKTLAAHRTLSLAQDIAVEIASLGQRVRKLLAMMQDPKRASAVAVMLPEPMPDRQTRWLLGQLKALKVPAAALFVNRVLLEPDRDCARCLNASKWQIDVLKRLRKGRKQLPPVYLVAEQASEVAGKQSLQAFTKRVWVLE